MLHEPVAAVLVGRRDVDQVPLHRGHTARSEPRLDGGLRDLAFHRGQEAAPQRVKHCQALGRRRRKKLHTELSTGVDNRVHPGGPGFRERNERGPGRNVSSIPWCSNQCSVLGTAHPRRACGRRPYHSAERGRKGLTYLDLGRAGP